MSWKCQVEIPYIIKTTTHIGKPATCKFGQILSVGSALVIHLICMLLDLRPLAFRHTYQTNPSHPCLQLLHLRFYFFLFPLIGKAEIAINTTVDARNPQIQLPSYTLNYSCFDVPDN